MNSIAVMRLLNQLNQGRPTPALVPLEAPRSRYRDEEEDRPRKKERKRSPPPKKERKRRPPTPESSSSEETEAYGSEGSSDYSSYDEPEVIKRRFAEDPCESISPAMLKDKKTKKEVVNYLESKECPKIEKHAKRKHQPPVPKSAPAAAPVPPAQPPPPPSAPVPPPAPPAPTPAPVKEPVDKKPVGRPKKPADPAAKPKKKPSGFNELVGKYRREGKTFIEAVGAAKEERARQKAAL
jgi:hypothetical protein